MILTEQQIAQAKLRWSLRKAESGFPNVYHQDDDAIRAVYEWVAAQKKHPHTKGNHLFFKGFVEKWAGCKVWPDDLNAALELHPEVIGKYPFNNLSSILTEPCVERLSCVRDGFSRRDDTYRPHEAYCYYEVKQGDKYIKLERNLAIRNALSRQSLRDHNLID